MKPNSAFRVLLVILLVVAVPVAFAQKTSEMPKYDVSKETKIKGTIEDIKEMTMTNNPSEPKAGSMGTPGKGEAGVHLMVKTSTETIEVRLCPSGYLKDFDVQFTKGQEIEVTGSRIKVEDKDVVLAREVVAGNHTVTLRDKQGGPVWTWLKKS